MQQYIKPLSTANRMSSLMSRTGPVAPRTRQRMRPSTLTRAAAAAAAGAAIIAVGAACAGLIPGTTIPDTPTHRGVAAVLEQFREALEARNADAILALVSPAYFEDMGTADAADDYGYHELQEKVLARSMEIAKEVFVTMQVHEIVVDGKQAHADIRYSSRSRLELPSGKTLWDSKKDFSRIEFMLNDDGRWLIVKGL